MKFGSAEGVRWACMKNEEKIKLIIRFMLKRMKRKKKSGRGEREM